MIPQIYLRKGKEESLLRRHPWIFSGAIDHIKAEEESDFAEGALVEALHPAGRIHGPGPLPGGVDRRARAHVRARGDRQAWWNLRIAVAYDVRRTLDLTDNPATTCYRLVHGEGDSLPGLVVDIYGPVAVIQCHSAGMYHARMQIAEALRTVYGARLTAIYDKSSQTLPFKAALGAVDGYLWGTSDHASHIVLENGERFCVNWEKGQKTGFFLDQARKPPAGQTLRQGPHRTQHLLLHGRVLGLRPLGRRRGSLLGGLFRARRGAGHGEHAAQLRRQCGPLGGRRPTRWTT